MTLFMLLVTVSGICPIFVGIGEGKKHGLLGIVIGIVIGAVIGGNAIGGAQIASRLFFDTLMKKARPHIASWLAALWYLMIIAWAFAVGSITLAAMNMIPWK